MKSFRKEIWFETRRRRELLCLTPQVKTCVGREVVVAITEGKLDFGPWEEIFYGEFDGGRRKRVLVKIIGE